MSKANREIGKKIKLKLKVKMKSTVITINKKPQLKSLNFIDSYSDNFKIKFLIVCYLDG
jgi:hypothetical protein